MINQDVVQHLCDIDHLFPGIRAQWTVHAALIHTNEPVQLCEENNDVVFILNHDKASRISYAVMRNELVRVYRVAVKTLWIRCGKLYYICHFDASYREIIPEMAGKKQSVSEPLLMVN